MTGPDGAVFAMVVARERGTVAGTALRPRLPAMFEPPVADTPFVEDEVVDAPRPPAASAAPSSTPGSPYESDRPAAAPHQGIRLEREVVLDTVRETHADDPHRPRLENAVLVGHQPGLDVGPRPEPTSERAPAARRAPRPSGDDSPLEVSTRPRVAVPSQDDHDPVPHGARRESDRPAEVRSTPRPPADPAPLRPVVATRVEPPAPPRPVRPAEPGGFGFPAVATRREINVRRPAPDRTPPPPPRPVEPVVRVSIGRIEIRAVADPPPPRTRRPERRTQSLDDYLERRNQGSRS